MLGGGGEGKGEGGKGDVTHARDNGCIADRTLATGLLPFFRNTYGLRYSLSRVF